MKEYKLFAYSSFQNESTWSKVVRCGKGKKKSSEQGQGQVSPNNASEQTTESQARATDIIPKTHWKFATVPGSRRIWGTMKNTICAAIQNDGTITKWWFVVHGEESLLADLDNQ